MWWLDDGPSTGTQPESQAVLQEIASQCDAETQLLRSELESLQAMLTESETARSDLDAVITQRDATRDGQLAQSEQAREGAEARADELASQLNALKEEAATLALRLETASKSRAAADCDLEHCRAAHAIELAMSNESRVVAESELRRMTDEFRECQNLQRHSAEQITLLETQVACLRSQVEAEQASRMRVEQEIQQVADELARQLADERQQWLLSQSQMTELHVELARRQQELEQLHEAAAAAGESLLAAQRRIEEQIDSIQALQRELDATRSSATETDARKTNELAETRTALAGYASELATSGDQINQLQQQLQESLVRNQAEQESRQRAEALTEPLTQEVALQRKRVEAFRGLAQREVAARRKLEAAIKRTGDSADCDAGVLVLRANIEVNERIRRLTTELTATRNQELSVRQRAIQEIKRAQEEVQQLKDQLAREQNAA
jgi:HAMP domain-containing protein